jgi:hypothetical protein
MELDGCKRSFDFLMTTAGLAIPVFVSDRHKGIVKYIRESHPAIKHFLTDGMLPKVLLKKCLLPVKRKAVKESRIGQKAYEIIFTGVLHQL